MKQKLMSLAGIAMAFAFVAIPALTHAQFSTSTAVSSVTGFQGDIAYVVGAVIAGILSLLAALVGLGWGIRKFLKWVGGRKF